MILTALILFLSVWAATSTRELKKEEVDLRLLSSPDFKSQFLLGLGARTTKKENKLFWSDDLGASWSPLASQFEQDGFYAKLISDVDCLAWDEDTMPADEKVTFRTQMHMGAVDGVEGFEVVGHSHQFLTCFASTSTGTVFVSVIAAPALSSSSPTLWKPIPPTLDGKPVALSGVKAQRDPRDPNAVQLLAYGSGPWLLRWSLGVKDLLALFGHYGGVESPSFDALRLPLPADRSLSVRFASMDAAGVRLACVLSDGRLWVSGDQGRSFVAVSAADIEAAAVVDAQSVPCALGAVDGVFVTADGELLLVGASALQPGDVCLYTATPAAQPAQFRWQSTTLPAEDAASAARATRSPVAVFEDAAAVVVAGAHGVWFASRSGDRVWKHLAPRQLVAQSLPPGDLLAAAARFVANVQLGAPRDADAAAALDDVGFDVSEPPAAGLGADSAQEERAPEDSASLSSEDASPFEDVSIAVLPADLVHRAAANTSDARAFVAPNVTALTVTERARTSLTLRVALSYSPATVHCGVYAAGDPLHAMPLASVDAVVAQGHATFVDAATATATVVVAGLVPATSYAARCVTTSQRGVPLAARLLALQPLQTAATLCCKRVTVANALRSVNAGRTAAGAITVAVDGLPSVGSVFVALRFAAANASTATATARAGDVVVFPDDAVAFSNASTALAVARALRVSADALGAYALNATLTGAARAEFEVVFADGSERLVVSAADAEPPTPVVGAAAQFSADGSFLRVSFSAATNRAGYAGGFPCDALFRFVGVARATCAFTDDATVAVYQAYGGAGDSLAVGGNVSFVGSAALQAACAVANRSVCRSWAPVAAATLLVTAPAAAARPTVQIAAPATIAAASVLGAKATPVAALDAFFANASLFALSPPTAVPAALLVPKGGQFAFTATLCNFLGACGSATATVAVLAEDDARVVPTVTLLGAAAVALTPAQPVACRWTPTSRPAPAARSCTAAWRWTGSCAAQLRGRAANATQLAQRARRLVSTSANAAVFRLPAFALAAPAVYALTARVYSAAATGAARGVGSAAVTLTVSQGPLYALIRGGDARTVTVGVRALLDAAQSYDADAAAGGGGGAALRFAWSCYQTRPPSTRPAPPRWRCSRRRSRPARSRADAAARRRRGGGQRRRVRRRLALGDGDGDGDGGGRAAAAVAITTPPAQLVAGGHGAAPGAGATVAAAGGAVRCAWSVDDRSVNVTRAALTPVSRVFAASAAAAPFGLVLAAHALPQRASLVFALSCASGGVDRRGAVDGVRADGVELNDADLPLTFQFGFVSPQDAAAGLVLSSRSAAASVSSTLPTGAVLASAPPALAAQPLVNVTLAVFDAFDASAAASEVVVVAALAAAAARAQLTTMFAAASGAGSVEGAKALLSVAASMVNAVNCSAALTPNCSSLHRAPCAKKSFTCGRCLDGFVSGAVAEANDACVSVSAASAASTASVGAACASAADCGGGGALVACVAGVCRAADKTCPSATCSGHGACRFEDATTGAALAACGVTRSDCRAVCVCAAGYFGAGCASDAAQLQAQREMRALLVGSLANLTRADDASAENVAAWAGFLAAAASDAYEVADADLDRVEALAATTLRAARDVGVDSSRVASVLTTLDGVAAVRGRAAAAGGRRRLQTVNASTQSLVATVAAFAGLVAAEKVFGEAASAFVFDSFRLVTAAQSTAAVAGDAANVSLAVPSSALEALAGAAQSAVTLATSAAANATGATTFSVSLVQTAQAAYTADAAVFFSDPLRLLVSNVQPADGDGAAANATANATVAALAGVSRVFLAVRNNGGAAALVFGNASVANLTTQCALGDTATYATVCARSGAVVSHTCPGDVGGALVSFCPEARPACSLLRLANADAGAGLATPLDACRVVNFTAAQTTCVCDVSDEGDGGSDGRRRRRLVGSAERFFDASGAADFVAATQFVAQDFRDTFDAAPALSGDGGLRRAAVVFALFAVVWGAGLGLLLYVHVWETALLQDAHQAKLVARQKALQDAQLRQLLRRSGGGGSGDADGLVALALDDADAAFDATDAAKPSAASAEEAAAVRALAEQMRDTIMSYVDGLVPSVYDVRESLLRRAWREVALHHRYLHVVVPDTRRGSLAARADVSYCRWDATAAACRFNGRGDTSAQAVLYVVVITCLVTAALKLPLDALLVAWVSPTRGELQAQRKRSDGLQLAALSAKQRQYAATDDDGGVASPTAAAGSSAAPSRLSSGWLG
eukprot:gene11336-8061_t